MNNIIKALKEIQQVSNTLDPWVFALSLGSSLGAAILASLLYQFFYENRGTGSQVHRSFPLLSISITTLFIGVQLSLPLSLGLLGSLSIIRFRTPIKEPEEVGFIMLIIASSISCATFNFQFLIILYLFAVVSLLVLKWTHLLKYFRRDGLLLIVLKDDIAHNKFDEVLKFVKSQTSKYHFESSASKDGETSYHLSFTGLKIEVPSFQVQLKKIIPESNLNVFFNRPGGIS